MRFRSVIVLTCAACSCFAQQKRRVIQIDISKLLNARPVTTLTGAKLINWSKGIDGNGDGDGYLTRAAALFNKDDTTHALPDNPVFASSRWHPAIQLHYNNADSVHNQARFVSGEGGFSIDIPRKHYAAIYLGLTSSEGPSALEFDLVYTDGTETKKHLLPDYYDNISLKDPDVGYVATDLAKWGKNGVMAEKDHHNIHLLKLSIDPHRKLKGIVVRKSKGGYLMFWSATGVTY
ncbi:hypothetical protein [Mucilaginibacter ginsenosidivorans]|uniref:Uncharacterized protein n=1 Tax=Mucilaginibacter ginsenosidivorans TaxID=398053 RepID=A0A5B8UVV6_9SPHI|nr:hypothetical protein [Mucilaginibacter ginsenosidivorans]QEC63083.1 hypothetical protein FRZ54_11005 [Mucilaginibacter ginsenosidivorans]